MKINLDTIIISFIVILPISYGIYSLIKNSNNKTNNFFMKNDDNQIKMSHRNLSELKHSYNSTSFNYYL